MDDFPDDFWLGVEQFNQGEFYACHDTLEAIWIEAPEADKKFYQGILQIAVALYHLGNQNWRGGVILIGEGLHRLRSVPPDYAGLDIADFMAQASSLLSFLQQQGADNLPALQLTIGPGGRGLIADHEQHRSQPYLDRL
jgi:predicted metal-dependent hydrolase